MLQFRLIDPLLKHDQPLQTVLPFNILTGANSTAQPYRLDEAWHRYAHLGKNLPGCNASLQTCSRDVIGCSSGACRTMVMLPTMHSMQPTMPNMFRRSFRTMCASTALLTDYTQSEPL